MCLQVRLEQVLVLKNRTSVPVTGFGKMAISIFDSRMWEVQEEPLGSTSRVSMCQWLCLGKACGICVIYECMCMIFKSLCTADVLMGG